MSLSATSSVDFSSWPQAGLGGPKGAMWPNSSAHATARALSLGFPGKGCLGLCLGSISSLFALWTAEAWQAQSSCLAGPSPPQ